MLPGDIKRLLFEYVTWELPLHLHKPGAGELELVNHRAITIPMNTLKCIQLSGVAYSWMNYRFRAMFTFTAPWLVEKIRRIEYGMLASQPRDVCDRFRSCIESRQDGGYNFYYTYSITTTRADWNHLNSDTYTDVVNAPLCQRSGHPLYLIERDALVPDSINLIATDLYCISERSRMVFSLVLTRY